MGILKLVLFCLLGLEVNTVDSVYSCNRTLTNPSGYFQSQNYPLNYPDNEKCAWTISVQPGKVVNIILNVTKIEFHAKCQYDSVKIYDGENTGAVLLANLCPTNKTLYYTSSTNHMHVTFNTDTSITASGFTVTYSDTASIGFTAWATSVVTYSAGTTLIFNGIDEGHNGFDQSTGLFTCPITGIYYVYVALRKNNLENIYVDVFKMDTRIIRFSENHMGSPWNIISNSALVSCSMGEIIQMKGWSSGSVYGEANVRWSSFSVINMDKIAQNSSNETFVGYSGYANTQSLSSHDPINFPNELCNEGNQFSSYRFSCPYTGIYFVSVTYWTHPSTSTSHAYNLQAYVKRNSTRVLDLLSVNPYNYVTNNALVICNKGEYIENKAAGTTYVYGPGGDPESIFTVMSVHPKDSTQPFIGFSRYKPNVQDCLAGDVITFTGITMDEGNYFQSNQFVCPVDGSYYFLLNLMKASTKHIEVDLKHGDKTVFRLEDKQIKRTINLISNSAVIRCLKDEIVKVVAAGPSTVYSDPNYTTFTGFLLHN